MINTIAHHTPDSEYSTVARRPLTRWFGAYSTVVRRHWTRWFGAFKHTDHPRTGIDRDDNFYTFTFLPLNLLVLISTAW